MTHPRLRSNTCLVKHPAHGYIQALSGLGPFPLSIEFCDNEDQALRFQDFGAVEMHTRQHPLRDELLVREPYSSRAADREWQTIEVMDNGV